MNKASPWPRGSHTLFDPPADFRTAAFFDSEWVNPHGRIEGFRLAAETLHERMLSNPSERNFLVYPYANNWRHCLELQLKALLPIIAELGNTVPPDDLAATHNLAKLWTTTRPLVEEAFPTTRPAEVVTVTRVIGQLTALDPDGQNFRYHLRVDGTPALQGKESIDLPKFHEALQAVCAFLDGAAIGAYEQLETLREIAQEFTP